MSRKLIYLIFSFVLMVVFASPAQAVYVDAEGGAGGNTVRASDRNPDAWWTTTISPTDILWARRPLGNDENGNLGTAFPADIFEATGNTTPPDPPAVLEDCPTLITTLFGLNPGKPYELRVVYWSPAGSQSWTIRAGFSADNMLFYDRLGLEGATAGTATGRTQSDRAEYTGLIGRIHADADGQIKAYIDDKPAVHGYIDRSWYDGISYELITKAYNPTPTNGATITTTSIVLEWNPGAYAADVNGHDVYLDTDFNDVNDATEDSHPGVTYYSYCQDANSFPATGLTPGATYYWRIDEVNDPNIWKGDIWSFRIQPLTAYNPSPPNDVNYVDVNAVLSWSAGIKVKQHKVYFGTTHPLPLVSTQANTTYDPCGPAPAGNMAYNTLYFWRIDEVNDTPTLTIWPGDEWEFRTRPFYVDANGGAGGNTVKADDGNPDTWQTTVTTSDGLWARRPFGNDPNYNLGTAFPADIFEASGAIPSNYIEDCMPIMTTISGLVPEDKYDVNIVYWSPAGSADWNIRAGLALDNLLYFDRLGQDGAAAGTPTGRTQADRAEYTGLIGRIRADVNGKIKVYIDDKPATSNLDRTWYDGVIIAPAGLTAYNPRPHDGAIDVEPDTDLTWGPGAKAEQHDVYLGTNLSKVTDANRTNPLDVLVKQDHDANTYDPGTLALGTIYYWRIDEVNDSNIWRGNVWRFTVPNYLPVDNFESYTNTAGSPNIIYKTWKDGKGYSGYGGNGTGSQVGYRDPNYSEMTIVHGGRQSMPFDYNNTKSPYDSNTTRTFDPCQDWTIQGVKSLTLWFRGWPVSVGSFIESPAGTYTMTASGTDIWDVKNLRNSLFHDEFHYAYMQISGDCTIVAKVESVSNTNASAKAGLMIRDSLDADSAHAMVCITPSSGVALQYRAIAGGTSTSDGNDPNITAPCWLVLERYYNEYVSSYFYNAWYSTKNEPNQYDWTLLGEPDSIVINMTGTDYIGLPLTAHNAAATCTAVFSNVFIFDGYGNPVTLSWTSRDIGIKSNTAAPLYVTLQDSGVGIKTVTHPDPNIALQSTWQAWNIALSDFAPVDPKKITKITIGVGNGQPGGTGTLYVDDIRLYLPRCMPGTIPDPTSSDCLIEYYNLGILTNNWLISNYQVTPAVPEDTNLVAYYTFDGNFNDSSGGHNGEPNGASIITNPTRGQVANFDGVNDYVSLPIGSVISSLTSSTFATWVNFSNAGGAWQRIFDFGSSTTVYMFLTPRTGTTGPIRFAIITSGTTTESGINAPSTLARGWHHVAVVINGVSKTMQLCLDGVVVASGTTAVLPTDLGDTTNNWLGRSQWTADAYLNGYLDDFRIYSRALSPGEVASLAGKTASFTQPLYLLLTPQNSGINLYNDGRIDLRDYVILAEKWLEVILWP